MAEVLAQPRVLRDVSTVDGARDLLTGITADLAHAMALAGACTVTGIAGVTGPTRAHSLDT